MIEELKEEKLIEKVGGRFRLSSLIQKRLVFLNKGSAPYVDSNGKKNKLEIVIQEILEDKIYLSMDDELVENPDGLPIDPQTQRPFSESAPIDPETNPMAKAFNYNSSSSENEPAPIF